LPEDVIEARVESVIYRLGICSCKNQLIGGWLQRGISGGERKRVSIGYELITEPSLLILDEPTSGLDSSTSLRIIKTLRKEA
jgi:ABC-type multidrug transport system ATPase subunit